MHRLALCGFIIQIIVVPLSGCQRHAHAIQQELAWPDESPYNHRLHGLLLVTGDHSHREVAELFEEDRQTVQRWVTHFEAYRLTGLLDLAPVADCRCRLT